MKRYFFFCICSYADTIQIMTEVGIKTNDGSFPDTETINTLFIDSLNEKDHDRLFSKSNLSISIISFQEMNKKDFKSFFKNSDMIFTP